MDKLPDIYEQNTRQVMANYRMPIDQRSDFLGRFGGVEKVDYCPNNLDYCPEKSKSTKSIDYRNSGKQPNNLDYSKKRIMKLRFTLSVFRYTMAVLGANNLII